MFELACVYSPDIGDEEHVERQLVFTKGDQPIDEFVKLIGVAQGIAELAFSFDHTSPAKWLKTGHGPLAKLIVIVPLVKSSSDWRSGYWFAGQLPLAAATLPPEAIYRHVLLSYEHWHFRHGAPAESAWPDLTTAELPDLASVVAPQSLRLAPGTLNPTFKTALEEIRQQSGAFDVIITSVDDGAAVWPGEHLNIETRICIQRWLARQANQPGNQFAQIPPKPVQAPRPELGGEEAVLDGEFSEYRDDADSVTDGRAEPEAGVFSASKDSSEPADLAGSAGSAGPAGLASSAGPASRAELAGPAEHDESAELDESATSTEPTDMADPTAGPAAPTSQSVEIPAALNASEPAAGSWFSVPGLSMQSVRSIPYMSMPALSMPSMSMPNLSMPAMPAMPAIPAVPAMDSLMPAVSSWRSWWDPKAAKEPPEESLDEPRFVYVDLEVHDAVSGRKWYVTGFQRALFVYFLVFPEPVATPRSPEKLLIHFEALAAQLEGFNFAFAPPTRFNYLIHDSSQRTVTSTFPGSLATDILGSLIAPPQEMPQVVRVGPTWLYFVRLSETVHAVFGKKGLASQQGSILGALHSDVQQWLNNYERRVL